MSVNSSHQLQAHLTGKKTILNKQKLHFMKNSGLALRQNSLVVKLFPTPIKVKSIFAMRAARCSSFARI